MTVRDLAGAAGCSETTILRAARRICGYAVRNGVRTDFDERDSVRIMSEVRKQGFVSPKGQDNEPRQNAELMSSILTAPVLRELVRIYGEKGAAKRIDHVIGYSKELAPAIEEARAIVPATEAAPYFEKIYVRLEAKAKERKQLELFAVN